MTEEIIKKRPQVSANCIGCGACVAIADEYFEFSDEGYIKAKKCEKYNESDVNNAINACPVSAISWIELK